MGSMFIVTVPVREHEVTLRKKEMHLSSAHQLDTYALFAILMHFFKIARDYVLQLQL